jgi:hypothetical protein
MGAKWWLVVVLALGSGCLTRAPTTMELDRRAGLLADKERDWVSELGTSSSLPKTPRLPVRVAPLVEKVWVADLPLGNDARLQGTWLYLEVEHGRWLDEVDPGGAPLVETQQPVSVREWRNDTEWAGGQ